MCIVQLSLASLYTMIYILALAYTLHLNKGNFNKRSKVLFGCSLSILALITTAAAINFID